MKRDGGWVGQLLLQRAGWEAEENGCGKNANIGMTYWQGLEELEEMTTWENEVKYLCA